MMNQGTISSPYMTNNNNTNNNNNNTTGTTTSNNRSHSTPLHNNTMNQQQQRLMMNQMVGNNTSTNLSPQSTNNNNGMMSSNHHQKMKNSPVHNNQQGFVSSPTNHYQQNSTGMRMNNMVLSPEQQQYIQQQYLQKQLNLMNNGGQSSLNHSPTSIYSPNSVVASSPQQQQPMRSNHIPLNTTNNSRNVDMSQNLSLSPRLTSILQETKSVCHPNDEEFYHILTVLNQNMIRTSDLLSDCSESELIQYGIIPMFAKQMLKKYQKSLQQPQQQPAQMNNSDQGSNNSQQSDVDQQQQINQALLNLINSPNFSTLLMNNPQLINSLSPQSNSTTSPIQPQNVVTPGSQSSNTTTSPGVYSPKANTQPQLTNQHALLLAQMQQQQPQQPAHPLIPQNYLLNNGTNMNTNNLNYSGSFVPNSLYDTANQNDLLTGSFVNDNDFMVAGTSLNSNHNTNSASLVSTFLSSSASSLPMNDIFGSASTSVGMLDMNVDHNNGVVRMGTSSNSNSLLSNPMNILRNQDGSLPTSISSGKSLNFSSIGSNQSFTCMVMSDDTNQFVQQQNNQFVRQNLANRPSTNYDSTSSSNSSPPGTSADHHLLNNYGQLSNVLGGASPEMMDMVDASLSNTVSYPCKVKSDTEFDGHKHWPKIASWFKREGDSEKELFTMVISKDNPTKKPKASTSATPNPNNEDSQDSLLDFRNKYIRISLSECGNDNLIKVDRVENDDVWGFLTADTNTGVGFIDQLKHLGFSESAYTISIGGMPPQKQSMGFEQLPPEKIGSVGIKQDEQLLLMRFPRYGSEQAKGVRKRKLLLVKYRFFHKEHSYSFCTLFNLRKENSNAAMSRDDIWISSLFVEGDNFSPVMRHRSPQQPMEHTAVEVPRNISSSSRGYKRVCDYELPDSSFMRFTTNSPTVGRGGVDVVCKIDLLFDYNNDHTTSLKRKFVTDPTVEADMFIVDATRRYDFLEKGTFKVIRVVQQVDHVDLVVRMPRPVKETVEPQTILFNVIYNSKPILDNPQTKYQGKFTYTPIDKDELSTQLAEQMFDFYRIYGSQFSEDVRKMSAEKIASHIPHLAFNDGNSLQYKSYCNLYLQFTELHYRPMKDESDMDEEEFIKAVNTIGHETRDVYGFTLLTHYAFRGLKKHCRILMNKFGMSFEAKDNLGVSVLEWCRLAHNPNNILELSYLEKSKTTVKHNIYTTSQSIAIKQQPKKDTTSSSPPSSSTSPRKASWRISDIVRNFFTSPSTGQQINYDEEILLEKEMAQLDLNGSSYDERVLALEERQAIKFYMDKLRKLDEKISSKHGQGKSAEKSQVWKDLYLEENQTIEAQNAICKDRFVAKHYGKTMENISKKHKDDRKPPLMTVKIIVSDSTNDFRNSLFDLFRPTYKDNLFGAFHTGLLIGPWRFDFYDHSIVRVRGDYRVYRNEYALSVIDVGSFSKVDQIKNALDTVANTCIEWNATKTYDAYKCNCQHFVTDVLTRLNLWQDKPKSSPLSPYERYLDDLRKGRSERKFYFSNSIKELKTQFPTSSYWEQDHVVFETRKELNDFCHWLDGMKYFENEESLGDIKLLKSFDRSFCMQTMNPEQEVETDDNTVWFFSEDGTEFANSLNKLVFNLPGVTFPQACRV